MKRNHLQQLALTRLKDAEILLKERSFSSAYYLGGYAVECALKAVIAKQMEEHTIPRKQLIQDCYSHDFNKLIIAADLGKSLKTQLTNSAFKKDWNILLEWSPESRYYFNNAPQSDNIATSCQDFLNAVKGVLPWLQSH
jgi:HEPN domain-containing protein